VSARDDPVAIVGAARTPFGKFGGALRSLSLPELGTHAATAALQRAGLEPADVDELALGVNFPGSDRSIARQVALRVGIPEDRNAYTVDRACCSSLAAIGMAVRSIRAGEARVALAGGAENLSRVPYFLEDMRWGHSLGRIELVDQLVISCPHTGVPRAVQAAVEAAEHGVGREEQDEWALRSQQRCADAIAGGRFDSEIVAVDVELPDGTARTVEADESPRPDTSLEVLARLKTVNGSTTITGGNAPGLSTGATSVALMPAGEAANRDIQPLATVVATAMVSGPPQKVASIPAVAAQRVLDRAGLSLDDVTLIEINEAFAAVPLVSTLVLAGGDARAAEQLREKTNVNGGAVAIGHPTGATGARLVMTLAFELARRGGGLGLVTICGGIGEGEAVLIRVG
jgi:acetyl-CoA C-acetyltransferase